MVLQFLCPNGHKIHCPDDRAGKAAKCPKCGVKFEIPTVFDEEPGDFGESLLAETDSRPYEPKDERADGPSEGEIEFLCPNGHRLHGPPEMQGQLGQCPDCGSEFRIPSREEMEESEEQPPEINFDAEEQEDAGDGGEGPAAVEPSPLAPGCSEAPALSELFARLWSGKSEGAVVELHLADGHLLAPERFAEELSQGSHAVFAASEADGTHTLSVVAWASITRVVVRGLEELPDEMRS